MRTNPRDWRIGQIESVAEHFSIKVRKPGGSHVVFMRDDCPLEVSIPARKPIKAVYVTQFIALIDWRAE
ncbi:type II toxin-antitoxin system HicA family toxin [Thiorhodococcus mannitoliphagus]|nr:type II toxin-antitoxin system HicA family toxin [Thiorhodococcus mannitoliphagus]